MKAGIALDDWKLPIFRKRLEEAGFTYSDAGAPAPGVTVLAVVATPETIERLSQVVLQCQEEAAAQKESER